VGTLYASIGKVCCLMYAEVPSFLAHVGSLWRRCFASALLIYRRTFPLDSFFAAIMQYTMYDSSISRYRASRIASVGSCRTYRASLLSMSLTRIALLCLADSVGAYRGDNVLLVRIASPLTA